MNLRVCFSQFAFSEFCIAARFCHFGIDGIRSFGKILTRIISMLLHIGKERFDEKPKQEHTEPKHHRKAVIKGITVYESFRSEGSKLWDCLLQSMGKN